MNTTHKLLHLDTETGFSGGEVQVLGLVAGLAEAGYQCHLAGPIEGELAAQAEELGIPFHGVRARNDLDFRCVRELAALLRNEPFDLAHLHTGRAAWLGGIAARRAGVPAVVTRRQDKRLRGPKARLAYGVLPSAVVGISPAVTEQLRRVGAPKHKLHTIWDAVDPAALAPSADRDVLRSEFGVGADEFCVVALAALVRRKGIDVLLDALAAIESPRMFVALVCGEGPERAALEERARALPLGRRAIFAGRVRGGDALAAADLFCLPSRAEGVGVAALEAMSLGLPVVVSNVGGLGEAVGDAGYAIESENAALFAHAIESLAASPEARHSIGASARERVAQQFLYRQQVEAYVRIYRALLAGGA